MADATTPDRIDPADYTTMPRCDAEQALGLGRQLVNAAPTTLGHLVIKGSAAVGKCADTLAVALGPTHRPAAPKVVGAANLANDTAWSALLGCLVAYTRLPASR